MARRVTVTRTQRISEFLTLDEILLANCDTPQKSNGRTVERAMALLESGKKNRAALTYVEPVNDQYIRKHSTPDDIDLLVIHHISKIVAKGGPAGDVIESILRNMSEMLGLNRGRVLTPTEDKLRIGYSYGLTEHEHDRGVYAIGEGVSGKVMQTGQAAVVQDVDDEPDLLFRAVARSTLPQETVSYIAIPIIWRDETVGVLGCHRLRNRLRSLDSDLVVLRILATYIAKTLTDELLLTQQTVNADALPSSAKPKADQLQIVGHSHALKEAFTLTDQVASTDVTVMITGESGTGKELFAQRLHNQSNRKDKPFVAINSAAIPEQLLESELFGHERGAFTGAVNSKRGKIESANGGTLFLDEIGDLSLELQAKLLRVLETKAIQRVGGLKSIPVDVRLVAATHKDLTQAVNDRKFRLDLFYRLNTFPLALPPLRERIGDIPLLAGHILTQVNAEFGCASALNQGVINRLESYEWPGNIRQLVNVIKRAVLMSNKRAVSVGVVEKILADESRICGESFRPYVQQSAQPVHDTAGPIVSRGNTETIDGKSMQNADGSVTGSRNYRWVSENERESIQKAIEKFGGNKTRAAASIGMTTRQLRYRMEKLEL